MYYSYYYNELYYVARVFFLSGMFDIVLSHCYHLCIARIELVGDRWTIIQKGQLEIEDHVVAYHFGKVVNYDSSSEMAGAS